MLDLVLSYRLSQINLTLSRSSIMVISKKLFQNFCFLVLMVTLVGCQKNMSSTDFQNLSLPSTPNYYYMGPESSPLKPNEVAPVFALSKHHLSKCILDCIKDEPRVVLIDSIPSIDQYSFIQRSFLFRFPDQIDIQFVAIDNTHSTFYALSRSQYGISDFGVNKARLQHWSQLCMSEKT